MGGVLNDAAKIQEEDLDHLNRRGTAPGEPPLEPLYRSADVPNVLRLFKRVPYGQKTDLGNGVSFTWLTFDEGYGGKPDFLRGLSARRQRFVGEVPRSFTG